MPLGEPVVSIHLLLPLLHGLIQGRLIQHRLRLVLRRARVGRVVDSLRGVQLCLELPGHLLRLLGKLGLRRLLLRLTGALARIVAAPILGIGLLLSLVVLIQVFHALPDLLGWILAGVWSSRVHQLHRPVRLLSQFGLSQDLLRWTVPLD